MRVQYIKHSGFLIEFEKSIFIFDYYDGTFELPEQQKAIYFFVSHKHFDHFSFRIFDYAKKYSDITFILSGDMKMSEAYMNRHEVPLEARDKIVYARKNTNFTIQSGVEVETLKSTDEGVAYLITYSDTEGQRPVTLYHAGDLNWWTWIGESEEEYKDMTKRFKTEMKKLEHRHFDLAMVPLDPRQEERFWWGFDSFMRTTDTDLVIPMHCWEDYSVIEKLKSRSESEDYRTRIVEVHKCGEWLIS